MTTPGVAYAVVTGGGTSGHVLAAVAVADALVARGHARESIHYVGTHAVSRLGCCRERGTTTRCSTSSASNAVCRSATWPSSRSSFARPGRRWGLIRRLSPKVVVNVGGYASFPATAAAMLRRIPVVVVSYDRRPGLVSKLDGAPRRGMRGGLRGIDIASGRSTTGAPSAKRSPGGRPSKRPTCGTVATRAARRSVRGRGVRWFPGAQRLNEVVAETVERLAARRIWSCITSSASAICPMPRPVATAATASCIECLDTRTACRSSTPQPI